MPVLASVGSVMVGSVAAVVISSKTEPLGAWLPSLNGTTNSGSSSTDHDDDVNLTASPFEEVVTTTRTEVVPREAGGDRAGLVGRGDRALLAMVLAISLLFAYVSSLVGSSDLLGCFLGGLAFSGVPGVERVWSRQVR